MKRIGWTMFIAGALLLGSATPAFGSADDPGGTFWDDDHNIHEAQIEAIAADGITFGCGSDLYCPDQAVTRGQMAAFLRRGFGLPASGVDFFADDDASDFEVDINALAAAGITVGCAPDAYCPDRAVTRGQMAAFLSRVLDLPPGEDRFVDDSDSQFHGNINSLAAAGITVGCNPAGDRFCPNDPVKRDQMASFLARALKLTPLAPAE
ncbi:MAG: S-layer homology domain-containing protein, partial [Acidimicrobiia bacterium]|nr:S-layer homology domain-containing protein [Acidimicrobiia bacterium]